MGALAGREFGGLMRRLIRPMGARVPAPAIT
jgi:hypothetical protein